MTQYESVPAERLIDYDLVILGVSWESRSTCAISSIGLQKTPNLCIRFASSDPEVLALKDANESKLRAHFENPTILNLSSSISFQENATSVEKILVTLSQDRGRPLKILLDITALPKSYCAFIVGVGFGRDLLGRLDFVYTEGSYTWETPDPGAPDGPHSIISEGEWSSLQVPYLEAQETIPSSRDLLVEIGGEIGYSLPFVERYEPIRLGLIFIKDGVDPVLANRNEEIAYRTLIAEPKVTREDLPIGDVIGVVNHIHSFCGSEPDRVVTGLAIGSKAHAVAMALAAVDIENLEVVCRIPTSYRWSDVAPTGRAFFYSVQDRFEPTSYFGS